MNITLEKALENFRSTYPNITSGDLQTFILGWTACMDSLQPKCDRTDDCIFCKHWEKQERGCLNCSNYFEQV